MKLELIIARAGHDCNTLYPYPPDFFPRSVPQGRRRGLQNRAAQFFPRFLKSFSMRAFQLAANGALGQARTLVTASLMTS